MPACFFCHKPESIQKVKNDLGQLGISHVIIAHFYTSYVVNICSVIIL